MLDVKLTVSVVLLALVPLALARCTCPPAPAGSKVCGSDLKTYDSQCVLECAEATSAASPGLAVLHQGPCIVMERVINRAGGSSTTMSPKTSTRGPAGSSTRGPAGSSTRGPAYSTTPKSGAAPAALGSGLATTLALAALASVMATR